MVFTPRLVSVTTKVHIHDATFSGEELLLASERCVPSPKKKKKKEREEGRKEGSE